MIRAFFATLGLVAIFITGACSSSTEEKPSAKTNSATSNENTAAVQTGSEVSPPLAADPNAPNAAAGDPIQGPAANRLQSKFDKMRRADGEPVDNAKVEAMALKNARPAPDNSTFVAFLTDAGYEIRIFKSHPQLVRVEKRVASDSQTIKVFLRGGRVVELPGNSISMLATASANTILLAAGVQPTAVPQKAAPSGAEVKKPGK